MAAIVNLSKHQVHQHETNDAASDMTKFSGTIDIIDRPSVTNRTNEFDSPSFWSRLTRHFSVQSPQLNKFLPRVKAGPLMLEVNGKASWKKYEVALAGSGIADLGLYYYTNKEDETPAGCILLHSAHVDVLEEMVMVITREKTWFLCAENAREANEWSSRICATLKNLSQGILGIESNSQEETRSRRRLSSNASSGTLREIQKREPKARVDEFLEIFVKSNLEDIRLQVMKGALSWSCMRNLTWKFWLGYLPQDMAFKEWIPTARSKRVRYINLRKQHTILQDSYDSSPVRQEQFLAMCDSTTENALLYAIYKDVRRTRSAMEYFCQPALQCLLVRVLYIYSKTHINISYNQGMSELLATIVYLLYVENFPTKANTNTPTNSQTSSSGPSRTSSFKSLLMNSSEGDSEDEASSYVYVESFINIKSDASYLDKDTFLRLTPFSGGSDKYQDDCREVVEEIIHELTNSEYLEHDSFLLLEEVMFRMAGAYCPEFSSSSSSSFSSSTSTEKHTETTTPKSMLDTLTTTDAATTDSSPLYDQMNRIHHHILSRCDPPTARHLSNLGVEPQMFLLRWVRVLMSREFEMVQVWQIWDSIFSSTPSDFSFINLLCVAAVREYREDILNCQDAASVLLCLRDLSDRIDADHLVDNARDLYDALMVAAAVEAAARQ